MPICRKCALQPLTILPVSRHPLATALSTQASGNTQYPTRCPRLPAPTRSPQPTCPHPPHRCYADHECYCSGKNDAHVFEAARRKDGLQRGRKALDLVGGDRSAAAPIASKDAKDVMSDV